MSIQPERKNIKLVRLHKNKVFEVLPNIENTLKYDHLKILIALFHELEDIESEACLELEKIKKITGLTKFEINLRLHKLERLKLISTYTYEIQNH